MCASKHRAEQTWTTRNNFSTVQRAIFLFRDRELRVGRYSTRGGIIERSCFQRARALKPNGNRKKRKKQSRCPWWKVTGRYRQYNTVSHLSMLTSRGTFVVYWFTTKMTSTNNVGTVFTYYGMFVLNRTIAKCFKIEFLKNGSSVGSYLVVRAGCQGHFQVVPDASDGAISCVRRREPILPTPHQRV